jgi:hypothetical protein
MLSEVSAQVVAGQNYVWSTSEIKSCERPSPIRGKLFPTLFESLVWEEIAEYRNNLVKASRGGGEQLRRCTQSGIGSPRLESG